MMKSNFISSRLEQQQSNSLSSRLREIPAQSGGTSRESHVQFNTANISSRILDPSPQHKQYLFRQDLLEEIQKLKTENKQLREAVRNLEEKLSQAAQQLGLVNCERLVTSSKFQIDTQKTRLIEQDNKTLAAKLDQLNTELSQTKSQLQMLRHLAKQSQISNKERANARNSTIQQQRMTQLLREHQAKNLKLTQALNEQRQNGVKLKDKIKILEEESAKIETKLKQKELQVDQLSRQLQKKNKLQAEILQRQQMAKKQTEGLCIKWNQLEKEMVDWQNEFVLYCKTSK